MAFQWIGKSADGKTVTLNRLELNHFQFPGYFNSEWEKTNSGMIRMGAVVDVETTGLSQKEDQVIEIGLRTFKFNRETGEVLSLETAYSAFQDPGKPLTEEIQTLTGITDEMVKGQSIDWEEVSSILLGVQIVVAHNASFDRPFLDRSANSSPKKIWACSLKQMDWKEKGFPTQKLDVLSIYHGFFTDAHRALNDSDALLYLLSLKDQKTTAPYFLELMNKARTPTVHLIASNSPFESKDHLRNRSYSWDAQNKYWSKQIAKDQLSTEIEWLEEKVYTGAFRGRHIEIAPTDTFKSS